MSGAASLGPGTGLDKSLATAKAEAALKGATLTRVLDDAGAELFIVSRWALTKQFRQMSDAMRFVETLPGHLR